ncbi:MAG: FABP family protein [Planctomycetes bacterium]|nr:FABP family protein [Planctomycetota bacterium]
MNLDESSALDADRVMAEMMGRLRLLLGTWKGKGQGNFPTIDAFEYDEHLTFEANDVEPLLHYEQRTWDTTQRSDHDQPLHWESGFVRPTDTGCVELCNAPNGGRVEVLRGRLSAPDDCGDTPLMSLTSVVMAHDERIISTTRQYHLRDECLRAEWKWQRERHRN